MEEQVAADTTWSLQGMRARGAEVCERGLAVVLTILVGLGWRRGRGWGGFGGGEGGGGWGGGEGGGRGEGGGGEGRGRRGRGR